MMTDHDERPYDPDAPILVRTGDWSDLVAERDTLRQQLAEARAHIEADHRREHSLRLNGPREVLERAEARIAELEAKVERLTSALDSIRDHGDRMTIRIVDEALEGGG